MARITSYRGVKTEGRGFTLVELLVVIGIIAILIAILMPALQEVRRQGARTKCLAHLREIGRALYMYSQDYKGVFPVVRQDIPQPPATAKANVYWSDLLAPYLTRAKLNNDFSGSISQKEAQFAGSRASVLWGCPNWEGRPFSVTINGISRYDSGYGMQAQPSMMPTYPAPGANAPTSEWNFRTVSQPGRYYKQTEWGKLGSQRIIVADSRLWWLHVSGGAVSGGKIIPQPVTYASQTAFDIDRFRHGKVPPVKSGEATYVDGRGRIAFNALFVDGHADTMTDVKAGYKAIRMKFP